MTTNDLPCLPPSLTLANLVNRLPALLGALFPLLVPAALSAQTVSYSGTAVNFGSVNVCPAGQTAPPPCSKTLTLTFTVTASGTLGTPGVLTLGAPNLDFTLASGSTCTGAVIKGNTCTVNINFAPRFAGERKGAVEVVDGNPDVLADVPVYGTGSGPQTNFQPGTESGIGSGLPGPNGVPTMANGLAVDGSGNVYIADWNNFRVLKETLTAGTFTESTIVSGLSNVAGIAVDGSGNVYICDWGGNRVLKETWSAGSYIQSTIGSGLSEPNGVAVDVSGNVYIADSLNGRVLKETLSAGSYTQADVFDCGSGGQSCPASVAVDGSGNLYVTAFNNSQLFKLTPSGGGFTQSMIGSGLVWPGGIAVDGSGNLYIADTLNSRVVKETLSAGSYTQSTVPSSALDWPWGVAVDQWHNVYIADSYHDRVLKEDFFDPPGVTFPTSTALGSTDTTDGARTVSLWNSGTQPLLFTIPTSGNNPEYPENFPKSTADTSLCAAGLSLAPGTSCDVSMNFVPSVAGVNNGSVVLTDNALNGNPATQSIRLEGFGGGTPPVVQLYSTIIGPPKQVLISSSDAQSGLAAIVVEYCNNCTANTPTFTPGTKNPVITTVTKTDQTKSSSFELAVSDMAGNVTYFDPVDMTIESDGKLSVQTLSHIARSEHLVQIANGTPGIHNLLLGVNGTELPILSLKNGETRNIDIGFAMKPGRTNQVSIAAVGTPGASVSIVVTQP